MALKLKVKKDKNGTEIDVEYWDIVRIYFNVDEKHLECELRGYETKQMRDLAKTGQQTDEFRYRFSMSGDDFPDITKKAFMDDVFAFVRKQNRYGIDWTKAGNV